MKVADRGRPWDYTEHTSWKPFKTCKDYNTDWVTMKPMNTRALRKLKEARFNTT